MARERGEGMEREAMKERLQIAILEYIEKELKEPESEATLQIIPAMAQVLLEMWNY